MANIIKIGGGGLTELTGNAATSDVLSGRTFYSNNPEVKLTGTLSLTGNAQPSQVLSGATFYNTDAKTKQTGTMANKGNVTGSVGVGGTYTIPAGYHSGGGKITGPSLSGNAAVSDVLNGRTFYSNSGTKQTGNMPNHGAWSTTINPGGSVTIPGGYHSGGGKVTASTGPDPNVPSGYRLKTGAKACSGSFGGVIPIFAWCRVGGAQWTNFPSTAYFTDNLGKTWLTCSVPANNGGVSTEAYIDVLNLYGNNYNQLKQVTSYSCTGSQAPSGACTLRVWLEKVG